MVTKAPAQQRFITLLIISSLIFDWDLNDSLLLNWLKTMKHAQSHQQFFFV